MLLSHAPLDTLLIQYYIPKDSGVHYNVVNLVSSPDLGMTAIIEAGGNWNVPLFGETGIQLWCLSSGTEGHYYFKSVSKRLSLFPGHVMVFKLFLNTD